MPSITRIMIGTFLLVFLSGVSTLDRAEAQEQVPTISATELAEALKGPNNLFLLDVRDRKSFIKNNIEGSVQIDLGELPERYNEVPRDKSIVVICEAGGLSASGAIYLLDQGYKDVRSLAGGMLGWSIR